MYEGEKFKIGMLVKASAQYELFFRGQSFRGEVMGHSTDKCCVLIRRFGTNTPVFIHPLFIEVVDAQKPS